MIYLTSVNEFKSCEAPAVLEQYLLEIANRSSESLAALYHSTSAAVYGFALSILKNTHDAEDVLHDCYVNIYAAAGSYRPAGKPMAWILTITRNLCLQKLREYQRRADIPAEDWAPYLESHGGITPEDRAILTECMNQLSDNERQIVLLHAVAGFKHREIAELMELPLPTVLSKYSRAIKKLKNLLRKESGNNEK
jgi:RNA polymerase sigma factor (sigma-70 family)